MKIAILHVVGLVGRSYEELGGQTPLQVAHTPYMDQLARKGELGTLALPPEGAGVGSEVLPLGLLGYDPNTIPTGLAGFEAAGLGVVLGPQDVAFRCTMVTLRSQGDQGKSGGSVSPYAGIKKLAPQLVLEDEMAEGISTEDAREFLDAVNEQLGSETIQFYAGTNHQHLMVWVGGTWKVSCINPQTLRHRAIGEGLPKGEGGDFLKKVMEASLFILHRHSINDRRREEGLAPANCLWLWGQSKAPELESLSDRYQMKGASWRWIMWFGGWESRQDSNQSHLRRSRPTTP